MGGRGRAVNVDEPPSPSPSVDSVVGDVAGGVGGSGVADAAGGGGGLHEGQGERDRTIHRLREEEGGMRRG